MLNQVDTIRVVLLDVDGVLTAGGLGYGTGTDEHKVFHARDGHAIKLAIAAGLRVGVVSGRDGDAIMRRARELGCDPVLLGIGDKVAVVQQWLDQVGLDWPQVAFVGDDLPDLSCVKKAGLGVAVADAAHGLARHADHVTRVAGGCGAVADLLTDLCRLQGRASQAGATLHG
ncbi:MAG: HAD hydrolase family protein [Planctomycetota bacterium]|nr:HAD hydrolase family protein [Planctomycetota bacterium]